MLEIEDGAAFTAIGIMSSAAAHIWRRVEWIPELSAIRRERKPPGHPGAVEKQDPDTANARVANSTRNSCIAASEVCFDQDKAQAGKDCNAVGERKKKVRGRKENLGSRGYLSKREGFLSMQTKPKPVHTLYLVSIS
jgi:hypothetical protein